MRRGFTLIEVMFALLFVAGTVIGIMTLASYNLQLIEHETRNRQAIDLGSAYLNTSFFSKSNVFNLSSPYFTVSEVSNAQASRRDVTVNITWSDSFNKDNFLALHRTYYAGVDE
jgi:Tfp pilus assembly protein PilV